MKQQALMAASLDDARQADMSKQLLLAWVSPQSTNTCSWATEETRGRIARLGTATPWTAMQRQTIMASDKLVG